MKKGDEVIIDVTSLSTDGKGISKTEEGFVIFSENTLPGDRVKLKINRCKKNYAEAIPLEFIKNSEYRVTPLCNHFGTCGGCKIQNYDYDKQIEFKTQAVVDAFERIGGFDNLSIPKTLKSDEIFFYRNKMEFSFSDDIWREKADMESTEKFGLGLHVPRFHSKILNIEKCYLQSELSNSILNFTRDFFKGMEISIYTTKTHSGFLRFLIIRESKNTKDVMVNLVTYDYDKELITEYSREISQRFPQVTTLVNSYSQKKAQIAFGEDSNNLSGNGFIYEHLNSGEKDFIFKISPNSFFQTNTKQAEKLFNIATGFLELKKEDNVLDLYCGAGSIAIFISEKVNNITGVELISDAIENAKENAKLNEVTNTDFILSDIKEEY
ncbi:MAG: 23S rRNA (uracil(1939)-C(5))-methyltransferase RlmD, partial [Ignavibacteriae bacterium]|nr:23S rRNA (uracil(1939)-C(5))-methyltransferase RlmD [Ignavibacteriota bacterium]